MAEVKLSGSSVENFRKLEKILPRIMRRMSTKTYGIIPSSVLSHFCKEPIDGVIFKGVLFKGQIKRVAFSLGAIIGRGIPSYNVTIRKKETSQNFYANTKRLSFIQSVDVNVDDGDLIELTQTPDPTCVIQDIHISILMNLKQNSGEIITTELEDEYI